MSLWQREKDSNPHIRSQSPLCYLYTIPLCPDEQKLLYRFRGVCQQFFQKIKNLSAPRNLTGYTRGSAGCGERRAAWLQRRKIHPVRWFPFGRAGALDASGDGVRTERDGRKAAAAAMRILYMYKAHLSAASAISTPYRRGRII